MRYVILSFLLICHLFISCKQNDFNKTLQEEKDDAQIVNFLKNKKLNGENIEDLGNSTDTLYNNIRTIERGLYYIILEEGSGGYPSNSDIVYINYQFFRIDNSEMVSYGNNYEIGLKNGANEGLRKFITLLKSQGNQNGKPGKGIVFMSSTKAFTNVGNKELGIEKNVSLYYKIELLDIKK